MVQHVARRADNQRITYHLTFPAELDHQRIVAWLRAISRTLNVSRFGLTEAQSMAFEVIASDQGISHRIRVPKGKADDIIPQLRALIPGVSATPEEWPAPYKWTRGVEVGQTNKSRPLRIPNAADTSTSILASLQPLKAGEAVIIQWVVAPARQKQLPNGKSNSNQFSILKAVSPANDDEIKERRSKLDEPNVMGVLRVAASAKTEPSAERLLQRVRTSFNAVTTPSNSWYSVVATQRGIIERVHSAESLTTWPAQVNVTELSALMGWPIGSPHVSGLPRGASRQLPSPIAVPRTGIVIGKSTFPQDERPVALSYVGGFQHTYILGGTGSGKSTLLANMAEQDMLAGHTVIVMEAKGDLFYETLARVPANRIDDVIVVDVQDRSFPVGYNVLQQGDRRIAANNIKNLFENHFPDLARTVWARATLHRGMETLATRDNTAFTDIVALFSPSSRTEAETDWKEELIRGLSDFELQTFWQRFNNQRREEQERQAAPLMDRAWIITETPEVRNIFGQTTSSFSFEEVLKENKILLINLSGIAQDAAQLSGTIFMQGLWTATQSLRGSAEKPAYLYLDEFQSFLKLPISTEEMLAKARSFKLGMRLAHQHLDQLSSMPEMRSAVMSNARNKIAFQLGADDSVKLAREFGPLVTPNDFQMLRQYEAFARVVTDSEGISQPFSLGTNPPSRPTGKSDQIIRLSRQKYGRPVEQVIHDMRARRSAPEIARKSRRPRISGEDWDEGR